MEFAMASIHSSDVFTHLRMLASANPPEGADVIAHYRGMVERYFLSTMPDDVVVQQADIQGTLSGEWLVPRGADSSRRLLFLHGGGYAAGSLDSHRALAARIAKAAGTVAFLVRYRLAPESPFPAALVDALRAYEWVSENGPTGIEIATRMFVCEDSAGGGLALALLLRIAEIGGSPADAVAVMSAWTDLTLSGESIDSLAEPELGATRQAISVLVQCYAEGRDLTDPLVSPLFGANAIRTPLLMHVSGSELLLDDTWRFAGKCIRAGNAVTVSVQPNMVHVWHGFAPQLPEAEAAIREIGSFFVSYVENGNEHLRRTQQGEEAENYSNSGVALNPPSAGKPKASSESDESADHTIGSFHTADGLTLRYRDFRNSKTDAPTLLCLPGLTRNSKDFLCISKRYADRYRVICPDFRGRALSDFDIDYRHYNPRQYVTDIFALLDHLNVPIVSVVGTSLGGLVAMEMATLRPGSVKVLALNDVGPEIAPAGLARILGYVGLQRPATNWSEAILQSQRAYGLALPDLSADEWKNFTARAYRECNDGTIRPDFDPRIGRAVREPVNSQRDLWELFRALESVQTLLLRGEISDVLDEAIVEKMKAVKPDLECVTVPMRGHVPLLDEPVCISALDWLLLA